ncbi:ferric reductase-like transmembrane domain-containing protein [Streptomyces sp. NBC_00160]|uniref:2Fe-2S iron-sulfur cluster-binding protein n=1 Tax=Streptomyces sp. NBC_00160 TaxID=2903628 RepID=UPI002251FD7A|nr:2Fe-2S iron-sulfur cluster-binding protein [Streptomyces sp. NBC_00160]MCX5302730.1 ferric reductase-like transmembrane domain-containing protein [Streptomyces sp. NBC_00160]
MDPKLWWYFARVGGLTSWWLLSATVVWGLLVSTRVLGPRPPRARLLDLHRFLAGFSLVFLALHLLGLIADSWVDIGLLQILFPFTSDYRPAAVAWGVIALDLLAAIQTTSLLKKRIPYRWWRYIHTTTFALFVLSTVHALTAGTDKSLVRGTALALLAAVAFLTVYRLLAGRRTDAGSGAPATMDSTPASPKPGALTAGCPVVVREVRPAAVGVVAVELAAADGLPLPAWEPGAHIDLVLPSGKTRPYSLCGAPADRHTYRIGVLRVPDGRGGSVEAHELSIGQGLAVRGPRNKFPLVLSDHYLFIAGGIGITALLPMARAVKAAGREWRMVYGGRSRVSMAFTDELVDLGGDRVRLVPQDEVGLLDLHTALADAPRGAAVYACGPEPMLTALEKAVAEDFPDLHLHTERFQASRAVAATTEEFKVALRRSGQVLSVPADRSLLDVIRTAVPDAPSSCEAGYCGSCELRVLGGSPDHRDTVLPAGERDRRDVIYPCVSRSSSPVLAVDL